MSLRLGKTVHTRKAIATPGHPLPPESRKGQPTLAVLPFRDLRLHDQEEYLTEGIAEEILRALNHVAGLWVVSRTTSFRYGGSGFSLAEVGRHLGADTILGGSLVQRDDLLTLQAELIDVARKQTIWSGDHDFHRKDLFSALEAVTRSVMAALGLSADLQPKYPADLEAYEFYLKGRRHYFKFSRQGMSQAAGMFRKALDIDPDYASAWAGLANCAAYAYIYAERTEPQRELAESCSSKALELDPDLAEAHASRGVALSASGQADEAEAAFETALCLDPSLFEAAYFYARHCFAAGKPERAIEYFEWAAALRPEDFQAILLVAQVYHSLGLEDEAERARRAGLALVEERLEHAPDDIRARYLGANALVALGLREKGLAWARMARRMDPEDPMLLYNLGCIHALAGDSGEALDCLEQAIAAGLTQRDWFLNDGDLDSVRTLPRFQHLMETLDR